MVAHLDACSENVVLVWICCGKESPPREGEILWEFVLTEKNEACLIFCFNINLTILPVNLIRLPAHSFPISSIPNSQPS